MKVHELIRELSALCGVGLRDADVEVQILTTRGQLVRRLVVSTERSNDQTPSVLLRAVPPATELEAGD